MNNGIKNPFSLANRLVILIGATGGLGKAVSRAVVYSGASRVALVDNGPGSKSKLQKLEKELKDLCWKTSNPGGFRIASFQCDITESSKVEDLMEEIFEKDKKGLYKEESNYSSCSLINMAGICENISAIDYPQENITRVMDINLLGSMLVAREFAKQVIKSRFYEIRHYPASIVLTASMSGSIVNYPQPQAPYNMTKAGVIHLSKSLASEWVNHNIRVNSLSPGYILTPMTKEILERDEREKAELHNNQKKLVPSVVSIGEEWKKRTPMGRLADPEELAWPMVFLASDASSFMTGSDLIVDGGYTIL
ncbi:uncharacterized protein SAPINGB_P002031 [Magnusiomyces paraingens]|uniref:Ketoreductase (KR) domain-containing protein n=1 Tax=Magnusiomyces paraingens TaxID=2606893 RepID=A0A5E8BHF9_9ASCO|nr:uncharacterized protein SAPINGB_P002031 [Saprochaete ingens]VVT48951.1 unnamed protein product [Saprochaete ingens]